MHCLPRIICHVCARRSLAGKHWNEMAAVAEGCLQAHLPHHRFTAPPATHTMRPSFLTFHVPLSFDRFRPSSSTSSSEGSVLITSCPSSRASAASAAAGKMLPNGCQQRASEQTTIWMALSGYLLPLNPRHTFVSHAKGMANDSPRPTTHTLLLLYCRRLASSVSAQLIQGHRQLLHPFSRAELLPEGFDLGNAVLGAQALQGLQIRLSLQSRSELVEDAGRQSWDVQFVLRFAGTLALGCLHAPPAKDAPENAS
jgi:hypothetical protein